MLKWSRWIFLFLQHTNFTSHNQLLYPLLGCWERILRGYGSAFTLRVSFSVLAVCTLDGRRNVGTQQLAFFAQSFSTDLMSAAWSRIIKARGLCSVDLSLLLSPLALQCPNDQYPGTCRVRLRVRYKPLQNQMICRKNKMYRSWLISQVRSVVFYTSVQWA